ncbi:MAG: RluA family pseudouridine synthase [Rhodospirillaceae bacterium]|nr:RluA family pseudouridine synthase [Rhodospirillaceae bacterium]
MAGSASQNGAPDLRQFTVTNDGVGKRLDRWLVGQNPDLSRSRIQQLITQGCVQIAGRADVHAATTLKANDVVAVVIPQPVRIELAAQALNLDVVFEDEHLIVINKPAGLVVHPAAGNPDRTLVNALLAHCGDSLRGIGGELRPGIVHRLDKDTSGLLIAAKSGAAHEHLSEQFANHTIERAYDALVWGIPKPAKGVIAGQIGRSATDRKKMSVRKTGGKSAVTHYRVTQTFGACAAKLECVLQTGRTHQIRVHMASIGHPVIGDPVYGTMRNKFIAKLDEGAAEIVRAFSRQALHARVLGFVHPVTGKTLRFERDPPADFKKLAAALPAPEKKTKRG